MNMLNQYKDVCDKIDRRILRPIVFKDVRDIYTVLSEMMRNSKKTLTFSTHNRFGIRSILSIEDISIDFFSEIKIDLHGKFAFHINKESGHKFYLNEDHSVFVIIDEVPLRRNKVVWIIKDR